MKKLIALAILCLPFSLAAKTLTADQLYEKQDYTQALSAYQEIAKNATGADLYKAQLRIIASQSKSGQYMNAAKTAFTTPLPTDPLWKARFLLYRITTAEQMTNLYQRIIPTEDEDTSSFENLSQSQWNDKINESFETLWDMRKELIKAPLEQETFIIDIKDADLKAISTLFDFVVLQWQGKLTEKSPEKPLPASEMLTLSYKGTMPHQPTIEKWAAILAEAYQLGGTGREDARLIWQSKRILLPFEYNNFFTFNDLSQEKAQAIQLLQGIAGYTPLKQNWWATFTQAWNFSKANYGKSYAAYQAARLLDEEQEFEKTIQLCDWTKTNLPNNFYTQSCDELAESIRKPVFEVSATPYTQDPAHTYISFRTRNISEVYARVYAVTPTELKALNRNTEGFEHLTRIANEQLPVLLAKPVLTTLVKPITYQKPYSSTPGTLELPPLTTPGFYVVALSYDNSFDVRIAPVYTVVLNSTHLALIASPAIEADPAAFHTTQNKTIPANILRFYTLNLATGQPEPGAHITYARRKSWDMPASTYTDTTDANGTLAISGKLQTRTRQWNSFYVKAYKNNNTAIIPHSIYTNFSMTNPFRLFVETDRAIYRPGQTVQFAVYGFEEVGRGFKPLAKNSKVQLVVRDANYEEVLNTSLSLNDYGTAQTRFTLPETGLLGNYSVQATYSYAKEKSTDYKSFQVEEYKRPEYEVKLDTDTKLQFGKPAKVTGKATYYFGGAVNQATVEYTVTRTTYRIPFCWWRIWKHESTQLAKGTTRTKQDGTFEIPFTPQPGADKTQPYTFEVNVSVRDEAGRSIDASQNYRASEQETFFAASFDKGFYDTQTSGLLAQAQLRNINSQAVDGKFTAEIIELENRLPQETNNPQQDSYPYGATYEYQNTYSGRPLVRVAKPRIISHAQGSLEEIYKNNKELRSVFKTTLQSSSKEQTAIQMPALPEGIYKLKLTAKNADTVELIFLVAAAQSKLALPTVAIAQHQTYYPGSQAKLLLGHSDLIGPKYIEIYQDEQFLVQRDQIQNGVSIYTLPIKNEWRGGIVVRWFGASNYQVYDDSVSLNIPYDNKELAFQAAVPATLKPGQKVNWQLSAKNASGSPVNAQAMLRVYDKSLDYYASISLPFTAANLYGQEHGFPSIYTSKHSVYPTSVFLMSEQDKDDTDIFMAPQMPRMQDLQMHIARYSLMATRGLGAMTKMSLSKAAVSNATTDSFNYGVAMEESVYDEAASTRGAAETESAQQTAARTDFSETAYFNPMIPIIGGKGNATFTMPESLTAWNVQALAFTPDVNIGTFTAQTVTQKDVMVRLSLPRFWREQDQSTLVAQITNVTDKKLTAEVTIDILVEGQDASSAFGIEKRTQTVSIPAKGNTAVKWPLTVPNGVGVAQITATVRSGKDTDAESRQLPLLPAKERLAESTTAALESGSQTLRLENLLTPDQSRQVSSVTLRVDPGLMLSVLNAMPQLLRPGYNDALSVANRYVPLAVVNAFYNTYPLLQKAVGNLPKRNTQTPVWENTDPSRLLLLEETPWLQTARDGATREQFLTDLFNPSAVEKSRAQAEKKLATYQTASGGFSWLPGGKDSEFITLRILASYAQILRYGGQIPQSSAKKALEWMAPRIEKNLQDSTGSVPAVSYALYAAYVFTAYPQDWKVIKKAPVQKWLDYADQHSDYMTPLGRTYAAAAYFRLGQNTKAQNHLDLVLSAMKTDPVSGAYFAPEAQSWLWYNDTLATQTATLRTLLEIRPESDKTADMVKWLLFNRQAQAWQDTTATAQAIYTLLEYMQRKGLLNDPAQYELTWGDQHTTLQFEPMDWSEKLSWTKQAENVPQQYYTAQVTKRGGLTGFVTLDAVYTTAHAQASQPGVLNVQRRYLLKYQEDGRDKVREITPDEKLPVGAEIEVELKLTASSAFDYVLLADPKPAGFENTDLTSGWTWNALSYYKEVRDAATNFFLDRVPAGTYTLRYTLRPTLAGQYHVLPAQVQSMYAPQFSAHSAATQLEVK